MKSILLFIAATVLLSLSVAVMAQKAYPEQSGVTLIGQPSLNALHFGIDLPASAINAAADRTEQEEEEESPMDDTSLVILPTALGDEEESVMADSNSGNSCRQSYSYPLFKQCDSRWGGNRLGSSVKISFFIESCLFGFKYLGQTTNKATIRNWLCSGKVVVLNVNGGGHWVLAKSYSNGVYLVNDPGYNRSSYAESQVVRAGAFV
ncbi:hypothetical protein FDP41_003685 [Naegleria fowleri]|uniref:Peptidase C39-like domain-containing protein n=1 Tax=Naegleria fowleri TaxID=5763 RepID=A0A6A5BQQ5_NAEFO|nr:uncharacterized protein FDP41_003685 [Naegleria fowleri]KAF0977032.1 hypothetical protein FDP41_003685 [Naegleria fowleri]